MKFVDVCLDSYGTRAMQKLLELIAKSNLPSSMLGSVLAQSWAVVGLVKDINGNHVIQKLLKIFPENNFFIFSALKDHVVELSKHKHGCCVLQRCIDHATEEQQEPIKTAVLEHLQELIQDPYGNYVIQYWFLG